MVLGGVQAFNLLSILLLVLPGLAGAKLYLRKVGRTDRFNRIDTVALSIGVSLCTFFVIYLWYWGYLSVTSGEIRPAPVVSTLEPRVDALSEQIFHYLVAVVLAVGGGWCLGSSGRLISLLPDQPHRRWLVPLEGTTKDDGIMIVTTDGDRIRGDLLDFGNEPRDLLLGNPKWVEQNDEGGLDVVAEPGGVLYVGGEEISRIYFDEVVTDQAYSQSGEADPDDDRFDDLDALVDPAPEDDELEDEPGDTCPRSEQS